MNTNQLARLAFLTEPQTGLFLLNFQFQDGAELTRIEISKGHLRNILIDGTAMAMKAETAE